MEVGRQITIMSKEKKYQKYAKQKKDCHNKICYNNMYFTNNILQCRELGKNKEELRKKYPVPLASRNNYYILLTYFLLIIFHVYVNVLYTYTFIL